jgi:hypothetical protein
VARPPACDNQSERAAGNQQRLTKVTIHPGIREKTVHHGGDSAKGESVTQFVPIETCLSIVPRVSNCGNRIDSYSAKMYEKTAMNSVTTGIGGQSSASDYFARQWANRADFADDRELTSARGLEER